MGLEQFIIENCPEHLQINVEALLECEEDVDDDDGIELKRTKVSESIKLLIRSHTHVYDINGKHVMFR
jgi:hypothetical protein